MLGAAGGCRKCCACATSAAPRHSSRGEEVASTERSECTLPWDPKEKRTPPSTLLLQAFPWLLPRPDWRSGAAVLLHARKLRAGEAAMRGAIGERNRYITPASVTDKQNFRSRIPS
ncbi:hypothetical protein MRX96_024400 [Rhipicephalus microplus]